MKKKNTFPSKYSKFSKFSVQLHELTWLAVVAIANPINSWEKFNNWDFNYHPLWHFLDLLFKKWLISSAISASYFWLQLWRSSTSRYPSNSHGFCNKFALLRVKSFTKLCLSLLLFPWELHLVFSWTNVILNQ